MPLTTMPLTTMPLTTMPLTTMPLTTMPPATMLRGMPQGLLPGMPRGMSRGILLALIWLLWAGCGGPANVWQGVNMIEIARNGETAPLEPVAGKITVFDFWAAWCAPCAELDGRLAELGRRYPDRLAIRKLEVVDGSSPAATQHLTPTTTLPHVKVFGADGALMVELSAPPADIAARIAAALATP